MIKIKLNREELSAILTVIKAHSFKADSTNQKIISGIVQHDFVVPGLKKLLTNAQRYSFNLHLHQALALTVFFKEVEPSGAYEKVRVYELLDQLLRQS